MATLLDADPLTVTHRAAQLRAVRRVQLASVSLWQLLDAADLDAQAALWLESQLELVLAGRAASVERATAYYSALRRSKLGFGVDAPPSDAAMPIDAMRASLRIVGPVKVKQGIGRGLPPARAMDNGLAGVQATTQRLVLNGGRSAVLNLMSREPGTVRYQRVAGGKACRFCAMLAGRGPVYTATSGDFEAHDSCSCSAEPVFL